MRDTITIRTADERDAAALIEYVAALRAERLPTVFRFDAVPSLDEEIAFIRRFAGESGACFVATIGETIVANLGVSAHRHPQTAHSATLGMAVLRPYRGQGIGTRLLDAAIEWGQHQGLVRLELEVFSNNSRAVRLYERRGFVVEGRRHGAVSVDGGFVDLLLMARRLGSAEEF
jgi:RimJ/RimL family protein N-acetyltransferase